MPLFRLESQLIFPPPEFALENGLLAFGGDLGVERLLLAYRMGIFPWYTDPDPILWWSPDPRLVLFPENLHVSRSLEKVLRKRKFIVTFDMAFSEVIGFCAQTRQDPKNGTWITRDMQMAYTALHRAGYAHSVEAWEDEKLAGGLYGVSVGRAFFGESMFTLSPNASKVAFVTLVKYLKTYDFHLIDCQVSTDHLKRFGAGEISRKQFLNILRCSLEHESLRGKWHYRQEPV